MILVDSSQIIIAAAFQTLRQKSPEDDDFHGAVEHVVWASLKSYQTKFGDRYGQVVVCCDGSNSWRRDIFPYYKWRRHESREESEIDWDNIFSIKHAIEKSLKVYGPWKVIKTKHAEGDDVIYHICVNEDGPHIVISSDHDLQQCKVDQWNPHTKELVTKPYSILNHVILGDSGDRIPNVLNPEDTYVEKRKKVVMSVKRKEALRKALGTGKGKEKKLKRAFPEEWKEIRKRVLLNSRLVNIKYTPDDLIDEILAQYKAKKVFKIKKLLQYFKNKGLKRHAKAINSFKINQTKSLF